MMFGLVLECVEFFVVGFVGVFYCGEVFVYVIWGWCGLVGVVLEMVYCVDEDLGGGFEFLLVLLDFVFGVGVFVFFVGFGIGEVLLGLVGQLV